MADEAQVAVATIKVVADLTEYKRQVKRAMAETGLGGRGAARAARAASGDASGPMGAYRSILMAEMAKVRTDARAIFMGATRAMLADWRAMLASMRARMAMPGLMPGRGLPPLIPGGRGQRLISGVPSGYMGGVPLAEARGQIPVSGIQPMQRGLPPGRRLPLIETTGRVIGAQRLLPGVGETSGPIRDAILGTDSATRANRAKRMAGQSATQAGGNAGSTASRLAQGMRASGTSEADIAAALKRMKFSASEIRDAAAAATTVKTAAAGAKAAATGASAVREMGALGRTWHGSTATHIRRLAGYLGRASNVTVISRTLELTSGIGRYLGVSGVAVASALMAGVVAAKKYAATMKRANEAARQLSGKQTELDRLTTQAKQYAMARSYVIAGPGTVFAQEALKMKRQDRNLQRQTYEIYAEEGAALAGEYAVKIGREFKQFFGWLGSIGARLAGVADTEDDALRKAERIKAIQKKLEHTQSKTIMSMSASAAGMMNLRVATAAVTKRRMSESAYATNPMTFWSHQPVGGQVTMQDAFKRREARQAAGREIERERRALERGRFAQAWNPPESKSMLSTAGVGQYEAWSLRPAGDTSGITTPYLTSGGSGQWTGNVGEVLGKLDQVRQDVLDTKRAVFDTNTLH